MRFRVLTNDIAFDEAKYQPVMEALAKLPVKGQLEVEWDASECDNTNDSAHKERAMFRKAVRQAFPRQFTLSRLDGYKRYIFTRKAMPAANVTNDN